MKTCTMEGSEQRIGDRGIAWRSTRGAEELDFDRGSAGQDAPDAVEDDYEVIDYWGSRDSLGCLAAWG
jgi:hypothetical protein